MVASETCCVTPQPVEMLPTVVGNVRTLFAVGSLAAATDSCAKVNRYGLIIR